MASKRASRYGQDPKFQTRQKAYSKRQYRENKQPIDPPAALVLRTQQDMEVRVENLEDPRYGEVVTVPAYFAGDLADIIGIDRQTLRDWTKQGILPESLFVKTKRGDWVYTYDQARAIWDRLPLLAEVTNERENTQFARELREAWQQMPDGLAPPEGLSVEIDESDHEIDTVSYVYALVDPRSLRVHYIGCSQDPALRLETHLSEAGRAHFREHELNEKQQWLVDLQALSWRPLIVILEEARKSACREIEKEWMAWFESRGVRLKGRYPKYLPGVESEETPPSTE